MVIGQYKYRLQLFKYDYIKDNLGGTNKTPVLIDKKWGNIKENTGTEQIIEGKTFWKYIAIITTSPWNSPQEDQFLIDNRGFTYQITGVLPLNEYNETVITAERIKGI